jgi:hypothetical protein
MSSTEAAGDVVQRLDSLCEFEQAPVTPDRLEPGSYFAGVALPLWVFFAGPGEWQSRLASFKAIAVGRR